MGWGLALDVGPGALRTDSPTAGCHRRAVVYWAPGPLPGGLTPPTCEAAPSFRFQLDLAPARRRRVLVSPVLASRDTVWRSLMSNVPAVDVGELSGYGLVTVNTHLTCDDAQKRRSTA